MSFRTYSNEEKASYIEEFNKSGLGKNTFARKKGIPASTLRGWLKENLEVNFGEINITSPSTISTNCNIDTNLNSTIIFTGPNIRIELQEGFNRRFLKKVIEALIYDK